MEFSEAREGTKKPNKGYIKTIMQGGFDVDSLLEDMIKEY